MKIIITMPVYRAARTLENTYREIPRDCFDDVLVVDDASSDDTVAVARSIGLKTRQHPANRGRQRALRRSSCGRVR